MSEVSEVQVEVRQDRGSIQSWQNKIPVRSRWRHAKSATIYVVDGLALFQSTSLTLDGRPDVLYHAEGAPIPMMFTRRCDEFLDGRFYRLDK